MPSYLYMQAGKEEEDGDEDGDEDDEDDDDDDDESDSEDEFEDSEGVEFQQGSDEVISYFNLFISVLKGGWDLWIFHRVWGMEKSCQ